MGTNNMTYVTVDVDVDLDDFSNEELIDHLESKGFIVGDAVSSPGVDMVEIVEVLYQQRRTGQDYQKTLDDLIYHTIGKIV